MDKDGKADVFKELANDKDTITKFISSLAEMAQTDPETKALIGGIKNLATLYAQNPEGVTAFFERLSELVTGHKDAQTMTLDEFLEAHPDIWETATEEITNKDGQAQLSLFEVTELESSAKTLSHITLPTTALTNFLKQFMNNPTRIENSRKGRISVEEHYLTKDTIITYKGEGVNYTIGVERVKELFAKRVQNGAKIFNFLLQKLNEQNYQENTEFLLSELVEAGVYANPDSAYRGLKTVLDKLMRIHVEGKITTYQGRKRKEVANTKAAIIAARTVTYNNCVVVLPPILRNSAPAITILPRWGYALQSENAYILLDYIYYLARQNTDKLKKRTHFTISLDAVRQHIGLPSPEEVKDTYKSEYSKLIIKPIEDAITAIEDGQQGNELKITPIYDHDYKNIHEYLKGYIKIELDGEALSYMEQRAIKEEKQRAAARRLEDKKAQKDKQKDPAK